MFNDKKNYRNKPDIAETVTINNKYFWRKFREGIDQPPNIPFSLPFINSRLSESSSLHSVYEQVTHVSLRAGKKQD